MAVHIFFTDDRIFASCELKYRPNSAFAKGSQAANLVFLVAFVYILYILVPRYTHITTVLKHQLPLHSKKYSWAEIK